MSHDAKIK